MSGPSYTTPSIPVSVIGSEFMAPYPFDIIVDTNLGDNLVITDLNHRILLKVKPCNTTFHYQRTILHPDGRPIATLRDKIMSEHNRWKAFRGDSKSDENMIFSAKEPRLIQFKTSLHVFLANKTGHKDVCDFRIKGSWSKKNCTIYMGDSDSSTKIAQMYRRQKSKKAKFDKDQFMVTIYPNVDYAFVISLIAIVDAMKSKDRDYAAQIITTNGSTIQNITTAAV